MTDEEYFSGIDALRVQRTLLDQEETRHRQAYLDSQEFRVGDEIYYTPPTAKHRPAPNEQKGFIFNADIVSWLGVSVYYTVCPPTKAGKMPKVAKNARRGTAEALKLRKVEESDD